MNADQSTDLQGWLPVDAVVVEGRPGLVWMEMLGINLTEPFLQQTVERARRENRAERFTDFDVLLQFEKQLESVHPTSFTAPSARCTSSLVANACRAVSN